MIKAQTRKNFKYFLPIQTRWGDNDAYGHVNNVVYLSLVDRCVDACLTCCRCALSAGSRRNTAPKTVGRSVRTTHK